jgi:hypothetical protein
VADSENPVMLYPIGEDSEVAPWETGPPGVRLPVSTLRYAVIGYVATTAAITGEMVRDLMAEAVEQGLVYRVLHSTG